MMLQVHGPCLLSVSTRRNVGGFHRLASISTQASFRVILFPSSSHADLFSFYRMCRGNSSLFFLESSLPISLNSAFPFLKNMCVLPLQTWNCCWFSAALYSYPFLFAVALLPIKDLEGRQDLICSWMARFPVLGPVLVLSSMVEAVSLVGLMWSLRP